MRIVNTNDIEAMRWNSPKGRFRGAGIEISEALGREPASTDIMKRHPFDVEILRIAPGQTPYPYHAHSAQWEFYHVISGNGTVRHSEGTSAIAQGDAFLFEPHQPHQIVNSGDVDLVLYVVADNPIGESAYFPDSEKWMVHAPQARLVRSEAIDYFDGEE